MKHANASIVLTGGGTGGHLYPALAVANALVREFGISLQQITYIGNEDSLEAQKVPTRGIPFLPLVSHGMPRRKNPIVLMRWAVEMFQATILAMRYLKSLDAKAVLGTGGYVAGPVLLAAFILKIPCMVHESDATPGLVNRLMAPKATKVTGAFPEIGRALKVAEARFYHTGNPVDHRMGSISKTEALAALGPILPMGWSASDEILVVVGGSQGALRLNETMVDALSPLVEAGFKIVHQCGVKHHATMKSALLARYATESPFPASYVCLPFVEQMPALWALADVAVCRAGSMTLSELFSSQTPAILVPFPYAAQNHQDANARFVEAEGAGILLTEEDLSATRLVTTLQRLRQNQDQVVQMKKALSQLAKPRATHDIAHLLLQLLHV